MEARTLARQRYLWEPFSFEQLPVEIISNLYQRFVKGGHGAVYTPPFLVAMLLDHAMPYAKLAGKERILDPACGSGVFLGGAFKRLINIWRNRHGWRDDPDRPDEQSENKLNLQLVKFLDAHARTEFPMVRFDHEEYQYERRSVDISASPVEPIAIGAMTRNSAHLKKIH